jgi:hypothetical protein
VGRLTVPERVEIGDLTAATADPLVLLPGGTATVSQVTYAGRPYIFKRYHDSVRATARPDGLQGMIDWYGRRSAEERARLNVGAAWVRHIVWDDGWLSGVLLPQAPHDFIAGQHPRTLDDLPQADSIGGRDRAAVRLNAFGHLIDAISWFHGRGVLINDLHAHNVLVRADGDGVYLVDCDSMLGEYWPPVLEHHAPDNMRDVPSIHDPTTATDFGRLAQVILTSLLNQDVGAIATHTGDSIFAGLCDLVTEPVARFICATRDGAFDEQAAREWRRLGATWRLPARAACRSANREPAGEGYNPIGGPLLPLTDLPPLELPAFEDAQLDLYGPDGPLPSPIAHFPPAEIRARSWSRPVGGALRPSRLTVAVVFGVLILLTAAWGLT